MNTSSPPLFPSSSLHHSLRFTQGCVRISYKDLPSERAPVVPWRRSVDSSSWDFASKTNLMIITASPLDRSARRCQFQVLMAAWSTSEEGRFRSIGKKKVLVFRWVRSRRFTWSLEALVLLQCIRSSNKLWAIWQTTLNFIFSMLTNQKYHQRQLVTSWEITLNF